MALSRFKAYLREAKRFQGKKDNVKFVFNAIKYYFAWRRSMEAGQDPMVLGVPWINFPALVFLRNSINKNSRTFEYGSGGSTIFLAQYNVELVSVEHNKLWFERVTDKMNFVKGCQWTGILEEPQPENHMDNLNPEEPGCYVSGKKEYLGDSFEKYVCSLDQFDDQYFDWILIDGRARPACFSHARKKVKDGGYMLWDNTETLHYQKALKTCPKTWEKYVFCGPTPCSFLFSQTTIWKVNNEKITKCL